MRERLEELRGAWVGGSDPWFINGVAMIAAIGAVLDVHATFRIYDECNHAHPDDYETFDTGNYIACEQSYAYAICITCCTDNPDHPDQSETCATYHEHGKDKPSCSTIAALAAHLEVT